MKRAIPWIITIISIVSFGASFSELQRLRGRFGEVTHHQFHDHQDVRKFMIKSAMAGLSQPIVFIGDSVTEMAKLPEMIGDKPVVNAGIGGATVKDFEALAPNLLQDSKPSIIVVALGTNNDAQTIGQDYSALLSTLKRFSPRLLAIAIPTQEDAEKKNAQIKDAANRAGVTFVQVPIAKGSFLADRIHLNANGYRVWIPALVAAISQPAS